MRDLVKLYRESFELITDNPNLSTDKIPDHLLEAWLSDEVIVITESEQPYFTVSIFHVAQDEYLSRKGITTDPDEQIQKHRFDIFQYILALESVNRQFPIKLRPVQILDFDNYDTPLTFSLNPQNLNELVTLTSALKPLKNKFKFN